jgi:hypothetical protein
MALHARRKGTNAALIYFPCCAWSIIENLPKASFCFIAISFITLLSCLHSMNFYLMSRIESILKLYSIAQFTEFPFQGVFICPNQTLDKRVTSVLLRRWNLSWNFRTRNAQCFIHNSLHGSSNSLVLDASEWQLDGASEYLILLHLYTSEQALKLMKTATSIAGFTEVDDLSWNRLGMTTLLIIRALSTRLVKIGPPNMCFFKVISLTKHKAWSKFRKFIVNIRVHN